MNLKICKTGLFFENTRYTQSENYIILDMVSSLIEFFNVLQYILALITKPFSWGAIDVTYLIELWVMEL